MKKIKKPKSLVSILVSPTPALPVAIEQTPPSTNMTQEIIAADVTVADLATPTPSSTIPQTKQPIQPTIASTQTTSANTGGLNADVLFGMVNNYRAAHGLPAFQKNDQVCSLAASRAPEIHAEVAGGYMHAGLKARNLPYWNTENIISMRSEGEAFNWWINDPIHHDAIVGNYTYSCMACSGDSCAEEFTNLQPK